MKKIVIFSGTSEGRELSELLTKEKMHHTVCVATGYGAEMMEESPYARVVIGRMDADGMKSFLRNEVSDKKSRNCDGIIIDATHPYASEATVNIRAAAKLTGVSYVRISRTAVRGLPAGTGIYSCIEDCAGFIDGTSGNILLTTGSKELSGYCKAISKETKARTFVRILPTEESLKLCRDQGIGADHIIAMQGPFCRELNEAMIRQYDIRHLVTKESGEAGGFKEKMDAALSAGVSLHVIARPSDEDGVSVEEAFFLVTGKTTASLPEPKDTEQVQNDEEERDDLKDGSTRIALVGAGMGREGSLTLNAAKEIEGCDAVFGAKRIIDEISCSHKYEMYRTEDIIPELEKNKFRRVVIVFSGDTGFYSGAKAMAKALKEWREDVDLQIFPGISSYSCLASRLGESYDDAVLLSLHGKNSKRDIDALAEKVRFNEKTFVLLSGAEDVRKIAERLAGFGINPRIFAGANLSYPDETVGELSLEEALSFDVKGPVTIFIKNPEPERRGVYRALKDSDLLRSEVPMTKEYVRHVSIIKLGLKEGDLLYDIGGGTGSVAIEAALQDPGVDVYTFEKKSEAAELIRQNIKRSGAFNVTVVEGEAEEKLKDMQKPDCVFIGGSGGRLREIMEIICSKGKGIRFVINAVTIETLSESAKLAEEFGASGEETILLSVTDVQKTGACHMLRGQNPIWIISFTI